MKRRELLSGVALAGTLPAWAQAADSLTLPDMPLHDPFLDAAPLPPPSSKAPL